MRKLRNIERWRMKLPADPMKSKSEEDYWAYCPCHCRRARGKATLHVYIENRTGAIMMNCFVCGATEVDVCRHLGFPFDWLKPDESPKSERAAVKPPITVDWNVALDMSACAVMDKVAEVAGDCQVASDQLIDALVGAFSDRLGSIVSGKINRAIAASTPPTVKTVCADGFEQKESAPEGAEITVER